MWSESLVESLNKERDIFKSYPDLGNFVVQQYRIQSLLILLIKFRAKLMDKQLKQWIEDTTLGTIIKIYQLCANKTIEENKMIVCLQNYNKKRNSIIHKIDIVNKLQPISKYIKTSIQLGNKIKKHLIRLIENEIKFYAK